MKCPKCRHENPDDAKFCNECAHALELICAACGRANRPGSKFCNECAHKLMPPSDSAPEVLSFDKKLEKIQRYLPQGLTEKILSQRDKIEGERKQVTVMFCDMEGFTPLSENLCNEDAYLIMEQVYEILIHKVHNYEGTVNEMTGDGIMALFGAPIALEDAAQRAIRSSLAIHREMAKFSDRMKQENKSLPSLKMRIGIHTGPVVVGTLGNDLRVEFKAVGDTVNLASRMEGLAVAGSTYVTQETFKLTEGFFRFEAIGARAVKGKAEPINVYRVLSPSTLRTRFDISAEGGLTPFVGRERELELLIDGFERCKQGRGQAFSIVAEAGVGKSRFLYEFRKDVINEDVTFLEGKCLSYSRSFAYHPVIDILKSNFDIREEDGDFDIKTKVKRGLEILKADKDSTLPYLLELLSVRESGFDQKFLSPETKRNRIIEALIQIVLKRSEMRPLIMAIEDLHWIDTSSEETLKNLLDCISGARVFLLFTYRPEFVATWGGRSYHSQINLNRLSNRESLKMVSYLLRTEDIDRTLVDLVLEKTEGVPFFIEEFIKSLKNLHIIKSKNGRYFLEKEIQDLSIPTTIQDVIMARVDSLPEEAREVLQRGSAIEREFSHKLIQQVADLPEQQLLSYLSALKDAELLYERGIYPDSTYIFKHALTREVVYDSILIRKKKHLHKKIGQAIQDIYSGRLEEFYEMLARHYYEGEDWETALDFLVKAGDKAIATYANQEALDYYAKALKVCGKLGTSASAISVDLAKKRGLVNHNIGNFREAIEDFNKMFVAARNLGNRHLEAMALAYRGWTEQRNHDMQTAENTLKTALSLANDGFEDVRFFASVTLGDLFLAINRQKEGEPMLRKAEQLAPRADDPFILAWWSVCGSRWLSWKGRFDDALKLQLQYHSAFKGGGETFLQSLWVESLARIGKGEYSKALEILEDVLARAKRIGSARVWVRVLNTLGWLYEELQDHRQAMAWNLEGLEAAKTANFPDPEVENNARLNLGDNLLALGSFDDAEKHFNKVEQVVRNPRPQDHFALWRYSQHLFHSYGELWLSRGNFDKAMAYADECLALAKPSDSKKNIVKGQRLRGQVFLSQGQLAAAEQELSVALSIAQQLENPTQIWKTFDALGRLRQMQGRIEETRQAYGDALAVIEKVASSLKNNSLEQTFLNSLLVLEIRQKVERDKERI